MIAAPVREAFCWWIDAPGRGVIRGETLRRPEPHEVTVQTLYSGVSAGTERLVFQGRVPKELATLMRAPFQRGLVPGPLTYGYAAVGRVIEGDGDWIGRSVFCLHPHQCHFVVSKEALIPVPAEVPEARAVLAANMETALNATWDAEVQSGERIAVVGAGVVGALLAYLLARSGRDPILVDIDPSRAGLAEHLGLRFAVPPAELGPFDVVFHASGAAAGLRWCFEHMAFEGRIIELSWFGEGDVALPLGGAFHAKRLQLRSSQVGAVAPAMRATVDHRQRCQRAMALLGDARLDALIDRDLAFEELPGFMARLAAGEDRVLCARLRYGETAHETPVLRPTSEDAS